jgi:hypothetical protein
MAYFGQIGFLSKNPFVSRGLGHNGIPRWAELIFLGGPPDFYRPLSAHSALYVIGGLQLRAFNEVGEGQKVTRSWNTTVLHIKK